MLTRRQWMGVTLGATAAGLNRLQASGPIPRKSPELAVTLNSGQQLLLSSLRGKVVAVEFLLTTCPHCAHCSEVLQRVLNDYGPKGFTVLGAAINEGARALIPEFVYRQGLKFPVGVCSHDMALDYLQWDQATQGPMMMPQLVFVDRKGIIRSHHPGDSDYFRYDDEKHIREEVAALVGETGARHPAARKNL
jgi:peroxiredoxin